MSENRIRLTQEVSCAGCAAKLAPSYLGEAVKGMDWPRTAEVLCATEGNEDAGVYRLDQDWALIQTTDFFTPVVDDPYLYGQVAAANALSDIYAMGGKPLTALNIVCFPETLPPSILGEILRGGADKAREAGCSILGGHSVKDNEIKYGMAVTGKARIKDIKYNRGARAGELLILTKPLGTGVLNTALKRGQILDTTYEALIFSMTLLNDWGAELMVEYRASGATDITGFSLAGHGMEMARASGVDFEISFSSLPRFPQLLDLIESGFVTRGDKSNRVYTEGYIVCDELSPVQQSVIFDPQTSGGLLFSVAEDRAMEVLQKLRPRYLDAQIIGKVISPRDRHKPGVLHFCA